MEYAREIVRMEASKQNLQMELEESDDRVCYLENCAEQSQEAKTQLTETLQALDEVRTAFPFCWRPSSCGSFCEDQVWCLQASLNTTIFGYSFCMPS